LSRQTRRLLRLVWATTGRYSPKNLPQLWSDLVLANHTRRVLPRQ
jgi:hypothetical protein